MRLFFNRSGVKTIPTDDQESPARRLGIMYVASLCAVAALMTVSQSLILREISWQTSVLQDNGAAAHGLPSDRSLSLHCLSLLLSDNPAERRELMASLRSDLARYAVPWKPSTHTGRSAASPHSSGFEHAPHFGEARAHLRAAIAAAEELLDALTDATSPNVKAGAIVRRVLAEEAALRQSLETAILQSERDASASLEQLRTIEWIILVFILGVLLLEGLYVIGPAVRRIQSYMEAMDRSHEEARAYAASLERSNRELQDFASVASHDLQEPLRKVQAFSDRLRSKYREALDDQGCDYLDRIQNAGKRMQTLINDLLTYSRVTTKAQPFVPVDLAATAREVVSDLEARIEQVHGPRRDWARCRRSRPTRSRCASSCRTSSATP